VEHGGLREVTKLSAVINTVELGGVKALSLLLVNDLLLEGEGKDKQEQKRIFKDSNRGI